VWPEYDVAPDFPPPQKHAIAFWLEHEVGEVGRNLPKRARDSLVVRRMLLQDSEQEGR
jgi:hypothetical protein